MKRKNKEIKENIKPNILELIQGTTPAGNYLKQSPSVEGTEEKPYIHAGLYTTLQKFGRKPKPYQRSLFDTLTNDDQKALVTLGNDKKKLRENIYKYDIEVAGIDLSLAQQKALDVIQKMLTETRYQGNAEGREVYDEKNEMKFKGTIPRLSFSPAQYLDFYGVEKHKTERGYFEYSGNARAEALQALKDLNDNKYFIYYERTQKDEKGEEKIDVITAVKPLISILEGYEGLTRGEAKQIQDGDPSAPKVTHLIIEPCTILIDQINSRFILKSASIHQEAKILLGKYSKYLTLLIEYFIMQATLNRRYTFTSDIQTLGYTLRLNSLIKTRQTKRLKRDILRYFEQSKQMGYVISYELENKGLGDKLTFTLNENKVIRSKP